MIKYRVHEVAKDLGVASKEIIALLKENLGEEKKHMTALTEDELNFIFEYYTQKNEVENFDEYFSAKNNVVEVAKKPAAKKTSEKNSGSKEKKSDLKAPNSKKQKSGPSKTQNLQKPKFENKIILTGSAENLQPEKEISDGLVINTRNVNVNIDKYNEKYDKIASEKINNENTTGTKQKIVQKSQQKNKFKNSKRETEAERLRRIAEERKSKPLTVSIPDEITVGELASRLKATAAELIKKLMMMGVMASINDTIDFDTASLVAMEFHAKIEKEETVSIEELIIDDSEDKKEDLKPRAPVVVVMGHVDHGKTSLLDAIRHADVTSTEAGGITQHIGAYTVNANGRDITFLDTPGHEAFTTMRARGAEITDIAILVVAADDGIKPQTIEAINHAKAAKVSIIVAINKMDKEGANPDKVMQQLTEHDILPEEWGGDTPCIKVSAKKNQGIDELLEMVLLIADLKELKANPNRNAKGTVIEAKLDKGRGPVATILIQNGTLNVGDIIVAGTAVGRVRAMTNDKGLRVKTAGPSTPVEITGLDIVPTGGDIVNAVSDEKLARELVNQRRNAQKEAEFNSRTKITLDNLFDQMQEGDIKELKVIVKGDVQGSVEAVKQSLEKISNPEVRVHVIHSGVGAINESDVMLANASNAIIVGFNIRPEPDAAENAKRYGVDMRLYRIIYECIEEIKSAMKGMLAPKIREVDLGRAECREVYKISNVGTIAGCYILSGKVTRNSKIRVVRDGVIICEDEISSLKRFKDDAKEVAQGFECGIGLMNFNDIKIGDIFEAFIMEEYRED
ncbi:MAG: translation initiation factor IF-2 [Acutalibacteraceae bacterium]